MSLRNRGVSALLILTAGALAEGGAARADDVQFHGFANLMGSESNTRFGLNSIGNNGSRLTLDPESLIGLNLSAVLSDKLTFAAQVLAQGNDGGNYGFDLDWLFVTYRPIDGLAIRAGRQINPIYLYSERIDVGFIYPWTRLPYEVYGLSPLNSFNGVSLIYTHFVGDLQLKAQLYGGGGASQASLQNGVITAGDVLDNKGVEVSASTDHFKLRAGYAASNPDLTITSGGFSVHPDIRTVQTFSGGVSFELGNFLGMAELAHLESSGPFVRDVTGAYGALGYRILPELTALATYSWEGIASSTAYFYPDPTISLSPKTDQHSVIFGLSYKLSPSILVKGEYMRTQQNFADPTLNFGVDTFTASLNVVF